MTRKEKTVAIVPGNACEIEIYCSHQQMLDPKGLLPHPDNNNSHTEEQVEMMATMIKSNGWRSNVVVSSRSQKIVAGHLRVRAAIALGMEKVPVDLQYFKNRAAEFKHLTADNELAKLSEFNPEQFILTSKELEAEMDPNEFQEFIYNPHEFGLTEQVELEIEGEDDPLADQVPVVKNPITRKGDVWLLGRHKLLCGDSTDSESVKLLMGTERADLVFTDPPYKMNMQGGIKDPIGKAILAVRMDIEHLCDFDPKKFLAVLPSVFAKGAMNAYVFCNKELIPDYLNWAVGSGYSFNVLVWKKPNAIPMGGSHRPDIEYMLLFRKGAIWNNSLPGVNYSKCLEFSRETSKDHPTMKPVGLIVNELLISSNDGSNVVEFFSGSGSTMIACEKTGRRCLGMEIDPTYTDVSVRRWMEYTGNQARLEATGQTYDEVQKVRLKKK